MSKLTGTSGLTVRHVFHVCNLSQALLATHLSSTLALVGSIYILTALGVSFLESLTESLVVVGAVRIITSSELQGFGTERIWVSCCTEDLSGNLDRGSGVSDLTTVRRYPNMKDMAAGTTILVTTRGPTDWFCPAILTQPKEYSHAG